MVDEVAIGEKFRALAGEFNERQRRLWAASEARAAGRGGIAATSRATGISAPTIRKGIAELQSGEHLDAGRVRKPGGGRHALTELDSTLLEDLELLVRASVRGDPESLLLWTSKSVRHLAGALRVQGHTAQRLQGQLSAHEIADLLGVSAGTVRLLARRDLRALRRTADRRDGDSCADCIPYLALRRPSKREVVRALRRWQRDTGAPPRLDDWREPGGRWEREYPTWPSAGDVQARFGSWPAALAAAAGLRPHRRSWSRDTIVTALQAWAAAHGRPTATPRLAGRRPANIPRAARSPTRSEAGRPRSTPPNSPPPGARGAQRRSSTVCARSSRRTDDRRPVGRLARQRVAEQPDLPATLLIHTGLQTLAVTSAARSQLTTPATRGSSCWRAAARPTAPGSGLQRPGSGTSIGSNALRRFRPATQSTPKSATADHRQAASSTT